MAHHFAAKPLPILLLAAAPLWSSLALAQPSTDAVPAEDGRSGEFFDVVDVEIVNIDVWVTDKQGSPVTGLDRDDFVVFRDGQQIETTNFHAVADGRPVAPDGEATAAGEAAPGAGEQDAGPTARGVEVAPEHRLWLVVFVDNYNIDPTERQRVFPALRTFLGRTLGADDQAMLVTFNRFLEVRQPFTGELHRLFDALDEVEDDAGHAVIRNRDRIAALERIDKVGEARQALTYARQYAEEQMSNVRYTADALGELIDTLGGLPGRKALIHVSSGIPMLAGEEMFEVVGDRFNLSEAYAEIPRHDTTRAFEKVNRRANEHRVVFYTIDAGGLRGLEFGSAEYAGFLDPRMRMTLDSVVPENLQAPLRFMALETGGKAIVNRNEILPALVEVARDFRTFYSLGVASSDAETGRYHEIEVRLRDRRRDLLLRHRKGYRSKSMDDRAREQLSSALLYDQGANPLDVTVTWGHPVPQERDYLLPIQLRVPMRDVVLLPIGGGRHEARLRLFVGAVEEGSTVSGIDVAPLGLRLADEHVEAARKEALVHTHKLLLSAGLKRVGVAILDVFGNQSSVVTRTLQIGPATDQEP